MVFVPALILNVLSSEVSHVAHWAAMGIGFTLSAWSTPLTSRKLSERIYTKIWAQTAVVHLMVVGLAIYLTQKPVQYGHRHVSDAGFSLSIPDRFATATFCERPSWKSEGMMLYSTGQWIHPKSTESKGSLVTTDWHDCGIEQITCAEQGTSPLTPTAVSLSIQM